MRLRRQRRRESQHPIQQPVGGSWPDHGSRQPWLVLALQEQPTKVGFHQSGPGASDVGVGQRVQAPLAQLQHPVQATRQAAVVGHQH